jgi:hypothetical protein
MRVQIEQFIAMADPGGGGACAHQTPDQIFTLVISSMMNNTNSQPNQNCDIDQKNLSTSKAQRCNWPDCGISQAYSTQVSQVHSTQALQAHSTQVSQAHSSRVSCNQSDIINLTSNKMQLTFSIYNSWTHTVI